MTKIEQDEPKLFEVSFDGKQPFAGSAVIGAFSAEAAETVFLENIPEAVTDLKVTVREMPTEEREAFFQRLEGATTH